MADNTYNQSAVAYEDGPKEVNAKRRMPSSEKQTGKAANLSQDNKPATKGYVKKVMKSHEKTMHRHKEHR